MVTAARRPKQKLRALQVGAEDYLQKPLDEVALLARVRSSLRAKETKEELALRLGTQKALGFHETAPNFHAPSRAVIVANNRDTAVLWRSALSPHFPGQIAVQSKAQVLLQHDNPPDLFIVAADLGGKAGGLRLLSDLRSRPSTRNCSVLIVVEDGDRDAAAMALDLGANDIVIAPFDGDEMALRMLTQAKRKAQSDQLRKMVEDGLQLAVTDPLTSLFNRRYAETHLAKLTKRFDGPHRNFAVMHLDIDRFKSVNDRFGHPAGDLVLTQFSDILRQEIRVSDFAARMGGEEFLIALSDVNLDFAAEIAERIRKRISATPFALPDGNGSISISVSIGLALWNGPAETAHDLIKRVDRALYAAKTQGRNKVTVLQTAA